MIFSRDIFDTKVDTNILFVTIRTSIQPHNYINSDGKCQLLLFVNQKAQRKRLPLGIYVNPKQWDRKKQLIKEKNQCDTDTNLMISNIKSKISDIKVVYRLTDRILNIENFVHEFTNDMPRGNFVKFFYKVLHERKNTISKATHDKERAVCRKLEEYKPVILFTDINQQFFFDYRNFMAKKKNKRTTRNGNIKIIKKYLRFASKFGIKLPIDINEIKAGKTTGEKSFLDSFEVKKCYSYYMSDFIPENQKIALGYFLFGCFTGLRFSDIMQQSRNTLKTNVFTFKHVKTGKIQTVELNKKAVSLINNCDKLFIKKYSNDHTRKLVQHICKFLQINKEVDFHMSRHTFGTNYIILGGNPVTLQRLMNHSEIKETMGYVHMAELATNAKADLMDELF